MAREPGSLQPPALTSGCPRNQPSVHPPRPKKQNNTKRLPSSPRRFTSSWDRVLCCFRASSRCGKHTSGYCLFSTGLLSARYTFVISRKARPTMEKPKPESHRRTALLKHTAVPGLLRKFMSQKVWSHVPLKVPLEEGNSSFKDIYSKPLLLHRPCSLSTLLRRRNAGSPSSQGNKGLISLR